MVLAVGRRLVADRTRPAVAAPRGRAATAALTQVTQAAYQAFIQPVVTAVSRCATQPAAASCLAAGTVAFTLIAGTGGDEGGAVGADTADSVGMAVTCGGESFTAATKVLLATGVAIPISQLKVGDIRRRCRGG